uniref:Zinc finger CCHC domain-containing protein 2-like n=1 Tax=Scleropages formosus TaxID=113540 RepID=A0A8C9RQ28_SCLFO
MKLPMRTAEEGGEEAAEDERVFEWFGLHLDPAKRIEFMCGLLHMCQPLELRFLGSCLEDLARKDFHVLRDFEIRANSPSELGLLGDVTDPVVRSKLLVCLSLLGSENRECAGILFRILSHADPALYFKAYDFSAASSCAEPRHLQLHPPCEDGDACGRSPEPCAGPPTPDAAGVGLLEQLALLFTMASLHPAFHFHQRESVRLHNSVFCFFRGETIDGLLCVEASRSCLSASLLCYRRGLFTLAICHTPLLCSQQANVLVNLNVKLVVSAYILFENEVDKTIRCCSNTENRKRLLAVCRIKRALLDAALLD